MGVPTFNKKSMFFSGAAGPREPLGYKQRSVYKFHTGKQIRNRHIYIERNIYTIELILIYELYRVPSPPPPTAGDTIELIDTR